MIKIAIHSVPRSGSTWLGNIFNSQPYVQFRYQPLFSYAFKGCLNANSSAEDIDMFFDEILKSQDAFINQKESLHNGLVPEFEKSYPVKAICYKEVRYHYILEQILNESKAVKVVLLIRNPLSVIYSWKNAPKEFKPELGWSFDEEWLDAPKKNSNRPEEYNGYTRWKETAQMFLELNKNYPEQTFLLSYNDLLNDSDQIVKQLFNFTGLDYGDQTRLFLKQSKMKDDNNPYSVYKVKKRDNMWINLPKSIIDHINEDLRNTSLEIFLKNE